MSEQSPTSQASPNSTPGGVTIQAGGKLPLFQKGKGGPSVWVAEVMNGIVKVCNAFLNFQCKVPTGLVDNNGNAIFATAPFVITEQNCTLDLSALQAGGGSGGAIKELTITSENGDNETLTCTDGTSSYTVFKPPYLQGAYTTPQLIYPKYGVGNSIVAAQVGGTWYDLNNDARAFRWQFKICDNGTLYYFLMVTNKSTTSFI